MKILLTNDDEIDAPGLAALYLAARELGEVFVVAPADGQSAASHSVTFHKPLIARRKTIFDKAGHRIFEGIAVEGRPADCVKVARSMSVPGPVDLIISGINAGANLGVHMIYSGTVAAAREGALMGTPSIAVSLHLADRKKIRWDDAAKIAGQILARIIAGPLDPATLLNVNIPVLDDGRPHRGVRVVPGSTAPMVDDYIASKHEEDADAYHATDHMSFHDTQPGTDVEALFQRFVTITPLHFDLTDRQRLPLWAEYFEG